MVTLHGYAQEAESQPNASADASKDSRLAITKDPASTYSCPDSNSTSQEWNPFRLLSVSSSTLFSREHHTGQENPRPTSHDKEATTALRISTLCDLTNQVVLDVQKQCTAAIEHPLAIRHFPLIKPATDLVIFDRGCPSHALMYRMHRQGLQYVIEAREEWWNVIRQMKRTGVKEKIATITLNEKDGHRLGKCGSTDAQFTCRLCEVALPDGSSAVLSTSILDSKKLLAEKMAALYLSRWKMEEVFKALQLASEKNHAA